LVTRTAYVAERVEPADLTTITGLRRDRRDERVRSLRREGGPARPDLKRTVRDDDPDLRQRERAGRKEVGMAVTAGAVVPLDEKRRRRHDLLAELREVDHWRRLVAARLDLAVAAVTDIDEPSTRGEGRGAIVPAGLREILGLPGCDQALPEASVLLRLRAAQRDLNEYAQNLRDSTDVATMELADLLEANRGVQRAARRAHAQRLCDSDSLPPGRSAVIPQLALVPGIPGGDRSRRT
jgi:hypothetical protein